MTCQTAATNSVPVRSGSVSQVAANMAASRAGGIRDGSGGYVSAGDLKRAQAAASRGGGAEPRGPTCMRGPGRPPVPPRPHAVMVWYVISAPYDAPGQLAPQVAAAVRRCSDPFECALEGLASEWLAPPEKQHGVKLT